MVIVGRHINGITINPVEYILDDAGKEMQFANIEDAKMFLKEEGFTDDDMAWLVFETVPALDEVNAILEEAVKYIIKKCASETESGTYYVHADDFPEDILTPGLFMEHIVTIADMMLGYKSVAEADVEDGAISTILCTDYCPNYVPAPDEADKYPTDRTIYDPLAKKQFTDAYDTIYMIENLLTEVEGLFNQIPPAIQQAILNHHNEPATLQHCIRWGLQAAKEIRTDWHMVVSNIPCGDQNEGKH